MKTKFRELIKFNGGNGAILCKNCGTIIRTGSTFTWLEKSYMNMLPEISFKKLLEDRLDANVQVTDEYLCEECKNNLNKH